MIKNLINKIKKNISKSLSELNDNYEIIDSNSLDTIIYEFIESDNKIFSIVGQTFLFLKDSKYDICKDIENESKYLITKDGIKCCDLKIGKTRATYDFINIGLKYDIRNNTDITKFKKIIDCL